MNGELFSNIRLFNVLAPFPENNNLRPVYIQNGGWHLSYFGDVHFILNKLINFSHQEFEVSQKNITERMNNRMDITGNTNIRYDRVSKTTNVYLPPLCPLLFELFDF